MTNVYLKPATDEDIEIYYDIRNAEGVSDGFYTQKKPLTWVEHNNWWYSRNRDYRRFIIHYGNIVVGLLNIGQLDYWSPEIGYALYPEFWGQGIGTEAVKMALIWLKKRGYGYSHTTCLKNNERSINLLLKCGFNILGTAREGEYWLTVKL